MGTAEDHTARSDPGTVVDAPRSCYQAHVGTGPVAPRGDEGFLRNHNVGTDENVILVVEPYAFANPTPGPHMQLPRQVDAGTGPERDAWANVRPEGAQRGDPQSRAYLPGVADEQQFTDAPRVNHRPRLVP